MNNHEHAMQLLPVRYMEEYRRTAFGHAEELRLRAGRRPGFICRGTEHSLTGDVLTETDLIRTMEKATGASVHTAMGEIANGYISSKGLRIGICGAAVMSGGEIKGFRNISSLAIRIPQEHRGICDRVIKELFALGYENTLVISPPGAGKTTALREIIRRLSDSGTRLGVIDERNELAASDGGTARFDLGRRSDVITGAPKDAAAMILLRGMNPEIIAMDEITKKEDALVIRDIFGCGVGILASAHASGTDELKSRPIYRELLEQGIFRHAIVISLEKGERRYRTERLP